jgi:hypothetical protein
MLSSAIKVDYPDSVAFTRADGYAVDVYDRSDLSGAQRQRWGLPSAEHLLKVAGDR